jgi:SNF2 family DNA or RNA helicase
MNKQQLPPILLSNIRQFLFSTNRDWAFCLGAKPSDQLKKYSLPQTLINQQKLKQLGLKTKFSPVSPSSLSSPALRPYQQSDVDYLKPFSSVALFSEMRTGKTPTALKLTLTWKVTNLLIIVPAILQTQWQQVAETWLNKPAYIITPLKKEWRHDFYQKLLNQTQWIIIISKDTFKSDRDFWAKTKKKKQDYVVIVDEAHFLRNYKSQQSKSICAISHAPYKILLTGTPTVNHQSDIFGLLKFLQPKIWTSYWKFASQYFQISKFKITYSKNNQKRFFFRWEVQGFKSWEKKQELQGLVRRFSVNHRQKEVLPWLPKIIYREEKLLMSKKQQKKYRELVDKWKDYQPLDILAKLKTLTLYPPILGVNERGCKIDYLVHYCQEQIEKRQPTLIFSTRSETFLEPLAEVLLAQKIPARIITGSLGHRQKEVVIKEFQEGQVNILLANLHCVGLGLDLSRAETIIFADRSYAPADNEQAEARFLPVKREVETRIKLVIDLVSQGTIDEQVLKCLKRKENLIKVLNENTKEVFGF